MNNIIEELRERRTLDDGKLLRLLENDDASADSLLHEAARETTEANFGREIFLRGLIEWSNVCRNDCLYCGIRRSNPNLIRYSLTREEILGCCGEAYAAGLRTFVLQGGENPAAALALVPLVAEIRASWPDCAITLSLGELPYDTYSLLRRSGADRYLLRHETSDPLHYGRLHPSGMSLSTRLECLRSLRSLGFQTGTGMMVGSPFQSSRHLLADLRFIEDFQPEMIGIGPFIPQHDTPFGGYPAGSAALTLRLVSILRLMHPHALIPATTALSTLAPDGRTQGILAGANVIMPDFTPKGRREEYALYEGKNAAWTETAANLIQLRKELEAIGRHISPGRGDHINHKTGNQDNV
ncbi:MAG: [FeFe] hydrogenase H-cluster radical SAM maturase HydE [Bacteroidales bacterium]|nr:[FeFe] hydrogenase H-cluster radical SAM maturase HydE [Bacteroidales bacterium]